MIDSWFWSENKEKNKKKKLDCDSWHADLERNDRVYGDAADWKGFILCLFEFKPNSVGFIAYMDIVCRGKSGIIVAS